MKNEYTLILIDSKNIYYYRPGMNARMKIKASDLPTDKTYLKFEGMGDVVETSFINETSIKASIFDHVNETNADGTYKKIEEKTFTIE